MLVLTRRSNQSVMIGHDVVITILEIRGDTVRVGIDAPRSVDVHREEVYREVQKSNAAAASPSTDALRSLASRRPSAPPAAPPE